MICNGFEKVIQIEIAFEAWRYKRNFDLVSEAISEGEHYLTYLALQR